MKSKPNKLLHQIADRPDEFKRLPLICIAFIVCAILLYGCIPLYIQITPAVEGKVVDTYSKGPIEGARLYFRGYPDTGVYTDVNGYFSIPPHSEWYCIPAGPIDLAPPRGDLVVEAARYTRAERCVMPGWKENWKEKLFINIELGKEQRELFRSLQPAT